MGINRQKQSDSHDQGLDYPLDQKSAQYNDTLASLRKTIQFDPCAWQAYFQLGLLFHDNQALKEAIACYLKVLSLKAGHSETLFHLGLAYQDSKKPELAVDTYQKALQADPAATAVYINLGTAYQMMDQHQKALLWYKKAVQRLPDNPVVHMNMGTAYAVLGQHDNAIRSYEIALSLKPDYEKALCYLYKQYQSNCDWENLEKLESRLDLQTEASVEIGRKPEETPFLSISRRADPAYNFAVAKAWSHEIEKSGLSGTHVHSHRAGSPAARCLNIGYLSNTFCNHPGAHLIFQLFGLHDRSRFKVFCYSYGKNDGSCYRKKIEADADQFKDIRGLSDRDAAALIIDDHIDILVDLRGFTRDGRLGVCAHRPAPIQVTYLGFPGTTGASFMDYIIVDEIIAPPSHRDWFSECLVYLPHCYQINDSRQAPIGRTPRRIDMELPPQGTVFCSFNTHYKFDPVIFGAWMKILNRVPGSVLWLLNGNERIRTNLLKEATRYAIKPNRIIFAEKLPKDEHLARLRIADLGLDTRIYGGHTTTTDALWAGLPVVSLMGHHFASRVSSSILTAAGFPELVTDDIFAYIDLAVGLGRDTGRLKALREKIYQHHSSAPLFDTEKMVRFIEDAYEKMWELYGQGLPPSNIRIDDPMFAPADATE